jgi:hypothetical protein
MTTKDLGCPRASRALERELFSVVQAASGGSDSWRFAEFGTTRRKFLLPSSWGANATGGIDSRSEGAMVDAAARMQEANPIRRLQQVAATTAIWGARS